MNATKAINILETNGFNVSGNGAGLFNVVSLATGATILNVADLKDLTSLARGIEYSEPIDVERAWRRPIRETGGHIVRG